MSVLWEGQTEIMGFDPSFRFRGHANFISRSIKSAVPSQAGRKTLCASSIMLALLCWVGVAAAASPDKIDVSGVWKGSRSTSGQPLSYKVQSIRFDLSQSGGTITGSYRCYAGKSANADCPSPTGTITSGIIRNDQVKLEVRTLPNQVRCSFKGKVNEPKMSGTYSCYAGGSLSTIGTWKALRQQPSH